VVKLNAKLDQEIAEREKLTTWVATTLRPSLQKLNVNLTQQLADIHRDIGQETEERQKIATWIRYCSSY